MLKAEHPEYTVSYRFEEMPTEKVFVFLTDHENTDGFPAKLLGHIKGADLIIQDCQFSRKKYDETTAGYGHGTPDYCVNTAIAGQVTRTGFTHHDVMATDDDIDQRVAEAKVYAEKKKQTIEIFACADYGEYEV